MPGKIKVKVLAGRNLPVMDRASDTTDAFVEIKFGGITHKTDVCRKSLNPHWNSTEWYRFEVNMYVVLINENVFDVCKYLFLCSSLSSWMCITEIIGYIDDI